MLDPKERFRKYSLRSVFDGILYIVKPVRSGECSPRISLRGIVRRLSGRTESPGLGIIGSRSVRNTVRRLLSCDLEVVLRADTHEAMLHIAAIKLFMNKI